MSSETMDFFNQWYKCGADLFCQAVTTGAKVQQDTFKLFNDSMSRSTQECFDRTSRAVKEFTPTAKKNLREATESFAAQGKKGVDTFCKAVTSAEGLFDEGIADKTMDLWQSSFEAMRTGLDAVTRANVELFETWTHAAERCCGSVSTPGKATSKAGAK